MTLNLLAGETNGNFNIHPEQQFSRLSPSRERYDVGFEDSAKVNETSS